MDLSYYMFEALAHPVYGVMGIEARPVDCYTKKPLPILPGFTNKTIYGERPEAGAHPGAIHACPSWQHMVACLVPHAPLHHQSPHITTTTAGWRWNPFFQQYVYFWAQGAGIDGTNATCVSASPGGGLNFGMVNGTNPAFRPFANATTVSMWVSPNIPPPPPGIDAPAVPPTPSPVPLKVC